MGNLLGQIGGIAGLGLGLINKPAVLIDGGIPAPARVVRVKSQKPYRANENRRAYDAQFRSDTEAVQNSLLQVDNEEWVVWRIIPAPAGSHWVLECMAPATVGVIPVQRAEVPDGMGGRTLQWQARPEDVFYAKIREASTERQLTAQSAEAIGRLQMTYQSHTAPAGFGDDWRVVVDGSSYGIMSITVDDENPAWRNAVLSRESD